MTIVTKKIRILCLRGYRNNVKVMQDQTRDLRRDHAPFYEWGHITKLDRQPDKSDNGWYHQYVGFDRVVEHIGNQVQDHGPFDAAVGFSQGGQILTALLMWYLHQRNERHWKCCLICSGTRVRDVGLRPLFEHADGSPKRVPIPFIHLIGRKDQYYDTCREHAELYADSPPGSSLSKFVFEHESGHRFPSGDRHPELYEKISDMIREHCNH